MEAQGLNQCKILYQHNHRSDNVMTITVKYWLFSSINTVLNLKFAIKKNNNLDLKTQGKHVKMAINEAQITITAE